MLQALENVSQGQQQVSIDPCSSESENTFLENFWDFDSGPESEVFYGLVRLHLLGCFCSLQPSSFMLYLTFLIYQTEGCRDKVYTQSCV